MVREYSLLALVVILQAAINWHFASQSFFFQDDFVIFQDAASGGGFNLHYLLLGGWPGELSPGLRLVALFIQRYATFDLALAFLLVVHSVGVVLVHRVLRLCAGPVWWIFPLTFAYGISIMFMPSLQWFSEGLGRIWLATLGLAAIHAYLCWRRTGRRAWLVWSVLAVGIALSFSFYVVKGALIPVYLILIRILLLDQTSVRESAKLAVREWRIWALYAIPIAPYVVVALTRAHGQSWYAPPIGTVVTYLRIAWLDGFVPGLFGLHVTTHSGTLVNTWGVALCQLALIAVAAFTIARRSVARRAWLFLVIVFLLNAFIVLPRVHDFGPTGIAEAYRYYVDFIFVLPILIAFAFARPSPQRQARTVAPSLPKPRLAAAAALVLLGYLGLTLTADSAITRASLGRSSRRWVENARADVAKLRRAGVTPVLLDAPVPNFIMYSWIKPGANVVSRTLPLFLKDLRFNQISTETFQLASDGHLRSVSFQPLISGTAAELVVRRSLTVTGANAAVRGNALCVSATQGSATVEFFPPQVLRGRESYLVSTYRTSPGEAMPVWVNRGIPYQPTSDRGLPPEPTGGTVLTDLGSLPTGVPAFAGFKLAVLPYGSACFDRFVVGSYAPRREIPQGS